MPLNKLTFKAGISSDITPYSNEGGFVDGDKIRFRLGTPEKMGGWSKFSPNTYQGSARRLMNWVTLDGSNFLGLGTHLKYYIEEGQAFNDITPIRNATSAGDVTFSATNGSTTVTVIDPAHGANVGDFVTFADAETLGGTITAAILNLEFQVVALISSNSYTITSSVAANGSDTGSGGSSTVGTYQINTGLDVTVGGTGWGAGQWSGTTSGALATQLAEALDNSETAIDVDSSTGIVATDLVLIENELITVGTISSNTLGTGGGPSARGASGTTAATHADNTLVRLATGNADSANDFVGFGNAASVTVPGAQIRLWSHDNFGEDLIINPRDGGLFYWDRTTGLTARAVELSATTLLDGETSVPQICKQIIVSDSDRHVIAFGCDALGASLTTTQGNGVQDPLLIRFSSQENPVDWFPTTTNTAGEIRLGGGSEFMQAVETKEQILVFTNKSLHAMKFIGPPFTFGIKELAKNITIISPSSAIAVDDSVYWMGVDTFYIYAGQTQQIPCSVKDKVFLDFNFEERDKVHAGVNSEFSEIIWFYPSLNSTEIDKYVTYNYLENVWYFGTLNRQAWLDRGIKTLPIATGGQYLYNHEVGFDDDGSAMTSFVESAPMALGDGGKLAFVNRIIPDVNFSGSTSINPSVDFTVKARTNSGSGFTQTDTETSQRSSTSPVEVYTDKLDLRVRGRTFALRVESTSLGTKFKLGTPQVNIVPDGRR
tara:strand:- start:364 stop:2511 length:2148 start_codon:yes stop_codon:yes gene_type:complete